MIRVEPFHPSDLQQLLLQPQQAFMRSAFGDPSYGESLAQYPSFTAWSASGKVIGCGGAIEQWENRAQVWALLAVDSGREFVAIHRAVAAFLDSLPYRRIETTVDSGFYQGQRWAALLGFDYEGTARKYTPNGKDSDYYAIVRD